MKVAVIQGGPSTEAEVSRKSAASVTRALEQRGHECQRFELDSALGPRLFAFLPEVVFPAVHGAQGEDGCLQGLLEIMGLPYVGCDVRASAIAADKLATKLFFRSAGLPVAGEQRLTAADLSGEPSRLLASLRAELDGDMVIKPVQGGSTIGISRVFSSATPEDLKAALGLALKHDTVAMAESYLAGQELTCAVLEDEAGPRALPVVLIRDQATGWYDFQSKYAPGGSAHVCPAPLSESDTKRVQEAAILAHVAIGARDLSRTDFILTKDKGPFLLEINTLPGMTDVSLFPDAARAAGMSFEDLIEHLVHRAHHRGARPRASGEPLPGAPLA
jgi:D-alanine-D-alanine ligase